MKPCSKCGITKPLTEFKRDRSYRSGVRAICKECDRQQARDLYARNPEKPKARHNRWKAANPEKKRESSRKYSELHKGKKKESDRKRRIGMIDRLRDALRNWRRHNPGKRRQHDITRRARKAGSYGKVTDREWQDLCNRYGNKCLCCGKTGVKLTRDHVIPLEVQGPNIIENIQPLCGPCNSAKGTQTIDYRI